MMLCKFSNADVYAADVSLIFRLFVDTKLSARHHGYYMF
jgi:hypothetical protein